MVATLFAGLQTLSMTAALAAGSAPGTVIRNQATGSFVDTKDGSLENIESNVVQVTVAEVAGITVTPAGLVEAPTGVNGAGPSQGNGSFDPEDVVYFVYEITNVGNDPTQFFIPGTASSVTNGSQVGQIEIIELDGDGPGPNPPTDLQGAPVPIQNSGNNTGDTITPGQPLVLGLPQGSLPPNGTLKVRIPIKFNAGLNPGDQVTAVLGDTNGNDNSANTQNQVYSANGSNGDLYTQDNQDGDGIANETPGEPANGDSTNHRQEASARLSATVGDSDASTHEVSGVLFLDNDGNDALGTEPGLANVTVHLYEDLNNDGILDLNDDQNGDGVLDANDSVASDITDSSGAYSFQVLDGNYLIQPDINDPDLLGHTYGGVTNTANDPLNNPRNVDVSGADITGLDFPYELSSDLADYGDAPDTGTGTAPGNYQTLSSDGGPSHNLAANIHLGAGVTPDADGFADGTDSNGDASDDADNGVFLGSNTLQGQALVTNSTSTLSINTSGNGVLNAWIDWNQNGDFSDPGEQVATDVAPTSNAIALNVAVPNTASLGNTYARFRYSTQTGLGPTGAASDGEVEDYQVAIQNTPIVNSCANPLTAPFNSSNYDLNTPLQNDLPNLSFYNGSMIFNASLSGSAIWADGIQVQNDATVGQVLFLQPRNASDYLNTNNEATYEFTFPTPISDFTMRGSGLNNQDGTTIIASYQGVSIPITAANFSNLDPVPDMVLLDTDGDTESDTVVGNSSLGGTSVNTNIYTLSIPGPVDKVTIISGKESTSNGTVTIGIHSFGYCLNPTLDFGDAPDTYGTDNVANNSSNGSDPVGATHTITNGIHLGAIAPDAETNAVAPLDATGDGAQDDGVTLSPIIQESTISLPVQVTGNGALNAWIDWNGNGVFDAGEQIATNAVDGGTGDTDGAADGTITLSITAPANASPGTTYARFRFSSETDLGPTGTATDGEVEDYQVAIASTTDVPNVLLVKRITAVNGSTMNDGINLAAYDPDPTYPYDDNVIDPAATPPDTDKWPVTVNETSSNFLLGTRDAGTTKPDDEIEYTIYFLSTGEKDAFDVQLCDRLPDFQTYVPDAFNFETPAPNGGAGANRGILVDFNGNRVSLTNDADGDFAQYYPPGSTLPAACNGIPAQTEDNGAVVVNLGVIPKATSAGNPVDSFGFIRFRAKVK